MGESVCAVGSVLCVGSEMPPDLKGLARHARNVQFCATALHVVQLVVRIQAIE